MIKPRLHKHKTMSKIYNSRLMQKYGNRSASDLDCDLGLARGVADDVSRDSFEHFSERSAPEKLGQGQLVSLEVGHRRNVFVRRDDATGNTRGRHR